MCLKQIQLLFGFELYLTGQLGRHCDFHYMSHLVHEYLQHFHFDLKLIVELLNNLQDSPYIHAP
ncbi:MAG: hypothetical protein EBT70_17380 [Betaproteobacteria bacterium]|nr:hypothetical protein [Betaproteobacteria bacterium]